MMSRIRETTGSPFAIPMQSFNMSQHRQKQEFPHAASSQLLPSLEHPSIPNTLESLPPRDRPSERSSPSKCYQKLQESRNSRHYQQIMLKKDCIHNEEMFNENLGHSSSKVTNNSRKILGCECNTRGSSQHPFLKDNKQHLFRNCTQKTHPYPQTFNFLTSASEISGFPETVNTTRHQNERGQYTQKSFCSLYSEHNKTRRPPPPKGCTCSDEKYQNFPFINPSTNNYEQLRCGINIGYENGRNKRIYLDNPGDVRPLSQTDTREEYCKSNLGIQNQLKISQSEIKHLEDPQLNCDRILRRLNESLPPLPSSLEDISRSPSPLKSPHSVYGKRDSKDNEFSREYSEQTHSMYDDSQNFYPGMGNEYRNWDVYRSSASSNNSSFRGPSALYKDTRSSCRDNERGSSGNQRTYLDRYRENSTISYPGSSSNIRRSRNELRDDRRNDRDQSTSRYNSYEGMSNQWSLSDNHFHSSLDEKSSVEERHSEFKKRETSFPHYREAEYLGYDSQLIEQSPISRTSSNDESVRISKQALRPASKKADVAEKNVLLEAQLYDSTPSSNVTETKRSEVQLKHHVDNARSPNKWRVSFPRTTVDDPSSQIQDKKTVFVAPKGDDQTFQQIRYPSSQQELREGTAQKLLEKLEHTSFLGDYHNKRIRDETNSDSESTATKLMERLVTPFEGDKHDKPSMNDIYAPNEKLSENKSESIVSDKYIGSDYKSQPTPPVKEKNQIQEPVDTKIYSSLNQGPFRKKKQSERHHTKASKYPYSNVSTSHVHHNLCNKCFPSGYICGQGSWVLPYPGAQPEWRIIPPASIAGNSSAIKSALRYSNMSQQFVNNQSLAAPSVMHSEQQFLNNVPQPACPCQRGIGCCSTKLSISPIGIQYRRHTACCSFGAYGNQSTGFPGSVMVQAPQEYINSQMPNQGYPQFERKPVTPPKFSSMPDQRTRNDSSFSTYYEPPPTPHPSLNSSMFSSQDYSLQGVNDSISMRSNSDLYNPKMSSIALSRSLSSPPSPYFAGREGISRPLSSCVNRVRCKDPYCNDRVSRTNTLYPKMEHIGNVQKRNCQHTQSCIALNDKNVMCSVNHLPPAIMHMNNMTPCQIRSSQCGAHDKGSCSPHPNRCNPLREICDRILANAVRTVNSRTSCGGLSRRPSPIMEDREDSSCLHSGKKCRSRRNSSRKRKKSSAIRKSSRGCRSLSRKKAQCIYDCGSKLVKSQHSLKPRKRSTNKCDSSKSRECTQVWKSAKQIYYLPGTCSRGTLCDIRYLPRGSAPEFDQRSEISRDSTQSHKSTFTSNPSVCSLHHSDSYSEKRNKSDHEKCYSGDNSNSSREQLREKHSKCSLKGECRKKKPNRDENVCSRDMQRPKKDRYRSQKHFSGSKSKSDSGQFRESKLKCFFRGECRRKKSTREEDTSSRCIPDSDKDRYQSQKHYSRSKSKSDNGQFRERKSKCSFKGECVKKPYRGDDSPSPNTSIYKVKRKGEAEPGDSLDTTQAPYERQVSEARRARNRQPANHEERRGQFSKSSSNVGFASNKHDERNHAQQVDSPENQRESLHKNTGPRGTFRSSDSSLQRGDKVPPPRKDGGSLQSRHSQQQTTRDSQLSKGGSSMKEGPASQMRLPDDEKQSKDVNQQRQTRGVNKQTTVGNQQRQTFGGNQQGQPNAGNQQRQTTGGSQQQLTMGGNQQRQTVGVNQPRQTTSDSQRQSTGVNQKQQSIARSQSQGNQGQTAGGNQQPSMEGKQGQTSGENQQKPPMGGNQQKPSMGGNQQQQTGVNQQRQQGGKQSQQYQTNQQRPIQIQN